MTQHRPLSGPPRESAGPMGFKRPKTPELAKLHDSFARVWAQSAEIDRKLAEAVERLASIEKTLGIKPEARR